MLLAAPAFCDPDGQAAIFIHPEADSVFSFSTRVHHAGGKYWLYVLRTMMQEKK